MLFEALHRHYTPADKTKDRLHKQLAGGKTFLLGSLMIVWFHITHKDDNLRKILSSHDNKLKYSNKQQNVNIMII